MIPTNENRRNWCTINGAAARSGNERLVKGQAHCFFVLAPDAMTGETGIVNQTILKLCDIKKSFGGTEVLRGISLDIQKGEFITFLGASGCGKTTTLRIIAGLEAPDSGSVILDGRDVTADEPNRRDVNTVFQNYALFPHMNVYQNITYSLKLRKTPKEKIKRQADEMLALVQLEGFERRMPIELSGGQKQRVAIARAVINNPSVLLLDEPLGALDLQLRRQMQTELKRLQQSLGITFIYITHDQEEAINMSDRIVVMNEGRLEQTGTPAEVYDHPKTSFVARFVGTANIFQGKVARIEGERAILTLPCGEAAASAPPDLTAGAPCTVSVRGENLVVSLEPKEGFSIQGVVCENTYAGGMLRVAVELSDKTFAVSSRHGIHGVSLGERVFLSWKREHAVFVEQEERHA